MEQEAQSYEQQIQKLREEISKLHKSRDWFADEMTRYMQKDVLRKIKQPQPCVKFKLNPTSSWIAKLMEETAEAVHVAAEWAEMDDGETMEFDEVIASPEELAEELTDVITVCTSWLNALGYDEEARGKLQERVNEKNRRRGYF